MGLLPPFPRGLRCRVSTMEHGPHCLLSHFCSTHFVLYKSFKVLLTENIFFSSVNNRGCFSLHTTMQQGKNKYLMLCREWKAARAAISDLRADLVVGVPEREKLGTPPDKVLVLHVGSTFSAPAPCCRWPWEVVDLGLDVAVELETRKPDGTNWFVLRCPGMEWGAWVCTRACSHICPHLPCLPLYPQCL